jgi:hypothetical protein
MRMRFTIENPAEVECTIKITMTMGQWDTLRNQLETKWPSSELSRAITHVLSEARKSYYAREQEV